MKLIEDHYIANRQALVKRMSFRAGDAAEDVVQEAYTRSLKYFHSYNPEQPFNNWFSLILNNVLKAHKNEERGFSTEQFEEELHDGTECNQFSEQTVEEIYELIGTKSLVQCEVLTYHFQQGYTAKEVSEITEHSYANCRQIVNRFRQELKELYDH